MNLVASTLRNGESVEPRQPACDLRLADAGRTDHEDVLGQDLLAHLIGEALAADAVAQRDRHRALGGLLADDVLVEAAHDVDGAQLLGGVDASCRCRLDRRGLRSGGRLDVGLQDRRVGGGREGIGLAVAALGCSRCRLRRRERVAHPAPGAPVASVSTEMWSFV